MACKKEVAAVAASAVLELRIVTFSYYQLHLHQNGNTQECQETTSTQLFPLVPNPQTAPKSLLEEKRFNLSSNKPLPQSKKHQLSFSFQEPHLRNTSKTPKKLIFVFLVLLKQHQNPNFTREDSIFLQITMIIPSLLKNNTWETLQKTQKQSLASKSQR